MNQQNLDISVICDKNKLDDRGCKGAPDLIVEILSPATTEKDMKDKLYLYEKHSVKEYWIVHPVDKYVMVFILKKGQYGKHMLYTAKDKLSTALYKGLRIDLSLVFKD